MWLKTSCPLQQRRSHVPRREYFQAELPIHTLGQTQTPMVLKNHSHVPLTILCHLDRFGCYYKSFGSLPYVIKGRLSLTLSTESDAQSWASLSYDVTWCFPEVQGAATVVKRERRCQIISTDPEVKCHKRAEWGKDDQGVKVVQLQDTAEVNNRGNVGGQEAEGALNFLPCCEGMAESSSDSQQGSCVCGLGMRLLRRDWASPRDVVLLLGLSGTDVTPQPQGTAATPAEIKVSRAILNRMGSVVLSFSLRGCSLISCLVK